MSVEAPGGAAPTIILAHDEETECRWCGDVHGKICPWVKALEFSAGDERVTRVEFLTPVDWPKERREAEEPGDYPRKPSSPN